jgi:hypothetical protein
MVMLLYIVIMLVLKVLRDCCDYTADDNYRSKYQKKNICNTIQNENKIYCYFYNLVGWLSVLDRSFSQNFKVRCCSDHQIFYIRSNVSKIKDKDKKKIKGSGTFYEKVACLLLFYW